MKLEQQALNNAILAGDIPAIAAALRSGADVNYPDPLPLAVPLRGWFEDPPLSDEARLAVVRCLVENGADVNKGEDDDECRPLLFASFSWNNEVFEYLLSQGADPNFLVENGAETLFDTLIFDWRFQFFNLNEPEDRLEGEDAVDWLTRLALKYGKPVPRILQMLKAADAKHYRDLHPSDGQ